eukprot:scaffold2330_cov376-Prasinococcus_capsulatus_cf.AAC.8
MVPPMKSTPRLRTGSLLPPPLRHGGGRHAALMYTLYIPGAGGVSPGRGGQAKRSQAKARAPQNPPPGPAAGWAVPSRASLLPGGGSQLCGPSVQLPPAGGWLRSLAALPGPAAPPRG